MYSLRFDKNVASIAGVPITLHMVRMVCGRLETCACEHAIRTLAKQVKNPGVKGPGPAFNVATKLVRAFRRDDDCY